MAEYTLKATRNTMSASRLAAVLSKACDDLYMQLPGDDTTVAVARVIQRKLVNIFTGPPQNKEDDEKLMKEFFANEGKKVVSGGTSANIVARYLGKQIKTSINYTDPNVPPTATIEGMDLVTEGVLTLSRTLSLLKQYQKGDIDENFFMMLDEDNGAAELAKLLIEECTGVNLYVGRAINIAHQNPNLPFDLSIRMNLVEQMKDTLVKIGREVTIKYF